MNPAGAYADPKIGDLAQIVRTVRVVGVRKSDCDAKGPLILPIWIDAYILLEILSIASSFATRWYG